MKKFLFAIMAIAAGLTFGSCASEEEQTEEVAEEPVIEEVIDTPAVDTTAVVEEPVVEEVAAPAPKKAAKKTETKKEEPAEEKNGITVSATLKKPQTLDPNAKAVKAEIKAKPNTNNATVEKPTEGSVDVNVSKGEKKTGIKIN